MALIGLVSPLSHAHDSAFLACAKYTDHEMRVACLEAVLNEALKQQNATINSSRSKDDAAEKIVGFDRSTIQNSPAAGTATNQERVEAFGLEQQARIVSASEGTEELVDEISALNSIKPNMWYITLNSGQVWQQVHPKRFELRTGDTVQIHSSGWGKNFRLTASRLSGFIQVSRVK